VGRAARPRAPRRTSGVKLGVTADGNVPTLQLV
jgi:hypothetical protein